MNIWFLSREHKNSIFKKFQGQTKKDDETKEKDIKNKKTTL